MRQRLSISRVTPRQKVPRSAASAYPLFPLVTDVGPEGLQLRPAHLVVGQEGRFDRRRVRRCLLQPGGPPLFLDPVDPVDRRPADPPSSAPATR
jgi:hypothetical protein